MCYYDVILLSNVISSIGPKISDADTLCNKNILFVDLSLFSNFI